LRGGRIDWEEAWAGDPIRPDRDQEQDQEQVVPEQKTTGWFKRLRR